jgi:Ca-activated chloride channel family protein
MHVETLFPSAKEDGEARGGVVLVRLDGAPADGEVDLVASWTERDGSDHSERATVTLPSEPERFDHDGIRKAVALARYARELRSWAREVHQRANGGEGVDDWLLPDQRGEHERESVPLAVSDDWAARFADLRGALRCEREAVGDDDLQREVTLLARLLAGHPESRQEVRE